MKMPSDTTPNAQAATGELPNTSALAATTPPVTTPEPLAGEGSETETISLDEAKKLRREAASLRTRLRAFEEAEQKAKDAELTAAQRAEKALADKTAEYDGKLKAAADRAMRATIEAQATRLGIIDPSDAMKLIDREALELDADGMPTNLAKLLEALVKAKPYLVGKVPNTGGGATNPSRSSVGTQGAWTQERYERLTGAEYAALPPEQRASLQAFLATNNRGR